MPNNRQWAFMFWMAVLLVWVLVRRDTRESARGVLRALASPKVLGALVMLALWVIGVVFLASRLGLWDIDRATDTAFWFVTTGLVLFGRFEKVSKEPGFVRRSALATLEVSALVAVLSELFVLHLVAELVLQPFFAILGGLSIVAARDPQYRPVKRLVDVIMLSVSACLLFYVVARLINEWPSVNTGDLLRQFALPIWLTVGVLPYIYVLGLHAAYELAFFRIDWKSEAGWWARARAKVVLLTSFHLRARDIGAFSGPWQFRIATARSFRAGRQIVSEFRQAQRDAEREEREQAARLLQYAGVDGVDENGRRLDRREFEVTTRALRWITTCQMGWYRKGDQAPRYRSDLLEFVLDAFAGRELPHPHGIEMRVSDDGQKWFAWRRTVSGWVFAIGAAGPPPDEWQYDGPQPPSGFPGDDPAWGEKPFGADANTNW